MIFYRVTGAPDTVDEWHTTRASAHQAVKGFVRLDIEIHQLEVPTDADGLLQVLRGGLPSPRRLWQITRRGGLQEIDADGYPIKQSA